MNIELIHAYPHTAKVKALFDEYTTMLIEGDETFKEYLQLQNYEDELKHLESKYGLPYGRLYLAYYDNVLAGCIGLRRIDNLNCEMKRLYVRPPLRGKRIGDSLVRQLISDAREIGYSHMLLDTLPFLEHAIRLYHKHGFYEIPIYNNSPMDTSIYMRMDL